MATTDNYRNIRSFDEVGVDVVGKDWKDQDVFMIWAKNIALIEKQREYYKPYLERAKTCFDFYRGKIFDEDTREIYENVEDKFVVEPNKMKAPINALIGELMQAERSGRVTVEGGTLEKPSQHTNEISTINVVLKHMERRWRLRKLQNEILQDSIIACYPVWLWFEPTALCDIPEVGPYHPTILPWDSTWPSPFNWRSATGRDITALTRFQHMTAEQMVDMWPDQEDVIMTYMEECRGREKNGTLNFDHIDNWELNFNAEQRRNIIFYAMLGINEWMAPEGYFGVYERNFAVKLDEVVAIDVFNTENIEIRPPSWDERRWQQFLASQSERQNTKFVEAIRPVKILWTTVFTNSGLVLFNDPSWYQENGRLPGIPIVPAMIDSIPDGPAKDMLSDQLAIAVAETEYLDDIRKNTGSVTVAREGAIQNIDDLPEELHKTHGFVSIKEEAGPIPQVITQWQRKPNPTMAEYSIKRERDMERVTMINPNLMGAMHPEQSGRAKNIEIARALITQSVYVDNWNEFIESVNNLLLSVMPYAYDTYDVLEIEDDASGSVMTQEVNVPEIDQNGNIANVVNDLSGRRYKWALTRTDDSPTAKEWEYKQAIIFLNSVPGPVVQADPSGKLLARFMTALPNRFLNEAGRALAKDADMRVQAQTEAQRREELAQLQETMARVKIDAERARKQGVNVSLTGADLAQFPAFFSWLQQFGMPTTPAQPAPQAQNQQNIPAGQPPQQQPQQTQPATVAASAEAMV